MDYESYLRFFLALVFVLGLIAALAMIARKLGLGIGVRVRPGRSRRLGIVEVMPLDAKRRLVLIRRDDVEHLLLLGTAGESVVERAIPLRDSDFARTLAETNSNHGNPEAEQ